MRKNCPNCGAPIDIRRVSCEYCGTPYERDDIYVRQPVYIYQEPLNIDPMEVQKRILEEQNRRLRNELNAAIAGVNNAMSMSSVLSTLNANVLSSGMHGSGTIEECCNAIPRVTYNPSPDPSAFVEPKTNYIWVIIKRTLFVLALISPIMICMILGFLGII